jgi:hypothetical protein
MSRKSTTVVSLCIVAVNNDFMAILCGWRQYKPRYKIRKLPDISVRCPQNFDCRQIFIPHYQHHHHHHHHHPVHEGLGVFPVTWSSKWNWSLYLFLSRPMFLRPFGLYCNACFWYTICVYSRHIFILQYPITHKSLYWESSWQMRMDIQTWRI